MYVSNFFLFVEHSRNVSILRDDSRQELARRAHVVLSFACPTNELKDYSDKILKQKFAQRL